MVKPIINNRSVGNYLRGKGKMKCYPELEKFIKEILDLCVQEATPKRKLIRENQLYKAVVRKADGLRKFVKAIKEDKSEKEITAERLIDEFDTFILIVRKLIKDAKDPVFSLETLNGYLDSEVDEQRGILLDYLCQIKSATS